MNIIQRVVVIFFCIVITGGTRDDNLLESLSGEIQSCPGCSLNRLPEVKAFIYEDVPHYENLVFKPIPGAPPELVLYNSKHEEVERFPLGGKTRKECNSFLANMGFSKFVAEEAEIFDKEDL